MLVYDQKVSLVGALRFVNPGVFEILLSKPFECYVPTAGKTNIFPVESNLHIAQGNLSNSLRPADLLPIPVPFVAVGKVPDSVSFVNLRHLRKQKLLSLRYLRAY